MGAIQGAINSALGAAAAVSVAAKRMSDQKELKVEQGQLAKEQFHEAKADITKLTGEQYAAGELLKQSNEAYDVAMAKRPGGKGNTKAAIAEKQSKALTEKEAAQRAFDELSDRIEAKKAMMERASMIMQRTNIMGGVR